MKRLHGFVFTVQRMVTCTYHLNSLPAISTFLFVGGGTRLDIIAHMLTSCSACLAWGHHHLLYTKYFSLVLTLWRSPIEKSCTQERWVFIGFPLIITKFYMIGLHKNVFNVLVNQKTAFISSRNRKNIGKKEVKAVRKS